MNKQWKQVFEWLAAALVMSGSALNAADVLKMHGILSSNMVIQRDKPIVIWGWAGQDAKVAVAFGGEQGC